MSADGAESANRLKPLKGHVDRVERPEDMFLIEKDTSAEQRLKYMHLTSLNNSSHLLPRILNSSYQCI